MRNFSLLFVSIFLVIMSSCVTQRQVEYLRDKNNVPKTFNEAEFKDYKLKSNDELYIQINSLDESLSNVFSKSGGGQAMSAIQPYSASLLSYSIDNEGYLLVPIVGNVYAKDKTITQLTTMLKDSLNRILSQPIVSVKLVNRYITVLGEVRNPGHFPYSQEKLSVYDAVSLAGDITDYGNRKEVLLIRNEDGKNIRINLNLTKSDILLSNYYQLRPNDILYVKPRRNRFWGFREFPFTIVLTGITTALLVLNYVKTN